MKKIILVKRDNEEISLDDVKAIRVLLPSKEEITIQLDGSDAFKDVLTITGTFSPDQGSPNNYKQFKIMPGACDVIHLELQEIQSTIRR